MFFYLQFQVMAAVGDEAEGCLIVDFKIEYFHLALFNFKKF